MPRLYREEDDFDAVTQIWFDAQLLAMPALMARMGHTLEFSRVYFRNIVAVENQIWVWEHNGVPAGFLALRGEFIDCLYVAPHHQRQGIGQALLHHAKSLSSGHLWLYTHTANTLARAFYEKNDFVIVKFGISPPPESEPDVEYHWHKPA